MTAPRLLTAVVAALALATTAAGAVPPVHVATLVASGFTHPSEVTSAPGGQQRLYVVEQRGLIRMVAGRRVLPRPFLDLRRLVKTSLLQGLFSVAFIRATGTTHASTSTTSTATGWRTGRARKSVLSKMFGFGLGGGRT